MSSSPKLPAALGRIERLLHHLYDAAPCCALAPHLIGAQLHRQMPGATLDLQEQLFVRQADDGLDLSLFLAPKVLHVLASDDPWRRLHAGNLPSLWLAVEGISHFVCLTWRFADQRPISALELELQAEVDKFLVAVWLCAGPHAPAHARQIWQQLFAAPAYVPQMPKQLVERYWLASRGAARFCGSLLAKEHWRMQPAAWLSKARRFARLPLQQKLADGS